MKAMLAASAALALALTGAARAATGSGTVDFTFTSFSGAFAWTDPGTESDPALYSVVGTVNGVQPVFDGGVAPRGLFGQEIISGDATISGETATMVRNDFGVSLPNVVSFTPVASFPTVSTGQPFKIGTFSFTNGAWFGGVSNVPVDLGFTLQTHSSTPEFNQTFNDTVQMVTNVKPASESCSTAQGQADEADFIDIVGAPQLGSLRVFEPFCNSTNAGTSLTATTDLWAQFGSLDLDALKNVQGDGFFSSSTGIGPLGVPEPSTWVMSILGLGALGLAARRRRALARA
jgi:hypothetical protein